MGELEMDTIISLIPDDEHVTAARQELEEAGIAKNKIDILSQPSDVWRRLGGRLKIRVVFKDAAMGALIGLFIGALYGIPAGVFNCRFMNCSLETSVILWVLASLFWVAVGGFIGAIVGLDRFEEEFYSYVEGVQRGEALFVVESSDDQAPEAMGILQQENGILIHDIREETGAR
jgi:hypothetical protein